MNFYPKYRNYYSLFNDKGAIRDIMQAGNEMREVLNMELKYTAVKTTADNGACYFHRRDFIKISASRI